MCIYRCDLQMVYKIGVEASAMKKQVYSNFLKLGFRVKVGWQHVTIAATLSNVCLCVWDTCIQSFGPILPYTIMGTTFANLFSI
jgi:hypothetical protein